MSTHTCIRRTTIACGLLAACSALFLSACRQGAVAQGARESPKQAATQAASQGSQQTAWQDPSPHQIRFVTVDTDVRLEVLDWGGSGRPVVLLAGSGNTAHVFDDFAPKLTGTGCCHVYGLTRRGHGASTRPAAGYDNQRLADDILAALDALRIQAPVLAGHSMAGGEITTLGHQHSDRLSGLVYLDALGDPRDWPASDPAYMALLRALPAGMQRPARGCAPPSMTFERYRAWQKCQEQFAFPEAELRHTYATSARGFMGPSTQSAGVQRSIGSGEIRRDYSGIRVPVLALFEFPRRGDIALLRPDEYHPKTDAERVAIETFADATKAYMDRWKDNLVSHVPHARLVDLPGAGHYVFLTREADVLNHMRTFVASLP